MSATVNGNFAELYRVRFGATPPEAADPHILWADTTASPATLKTYSGGAWVPVAGGDGGQGGGVASVAVTPPATNTGTPTAPVIGVAPATAQAAGSLAAADYGKLQGVAAGAQANVLEAVSGTAPITVGAVANKAQAIGIAPASQAAPGSLSAADKTKLDSLPTGAQANVLEDVTLGSSTTAVIVSNGGAGGIVGKVKSLAFTIANAVAGGAAGLLSGADKAKLDGVAAGAEVNVLTGVTGTAPITAGAVAGKQQAVGIAAATTSAAGSMSAADKVLLGHLTEPTATTAQLRAAAGALYLAAKEAVQLGANAWWDGANWQRHDTAKGGWVAILRDNGANLEVAQFAAGANPIAFAATYTVDTTGLAYAANPPRGKCYGGTSPTGVGTWSNLAAAAQAYNTAGAGGAAPLVLNPAQFTAPRAGVYHFEVVGTFPAGVAALLGFRLDGSGSTILAQTPMVSVAGLATYGAASLDTELAAGSVINPALYLLGTTQTFTLTYFAGRYVSPP